MPYFLISKKKGKKYGKLSIGEYTETPSGRKLKNKYAIYEVSTMKLVSTASGLSKTKAKELLPYYQKHKVFVFNG